MDVRSMINTEETLIVIEKRLNNQSDFGLINVNEAMKIITNEVEKMIKGE